MKKILFATTNEGKMREIRMIMEGSGYEITSLKDAGIKVDIDENGSTFEENALIKANALRPYTDGIILADDSGLEVDYLNKEPGVHSARYMGEDTSYDIKNQSIIDRLDGVEGNDRSARFVCDCSQLSRWPYRCHTRNHRGCNRKDTGRLRWLWL